MRNVKDLPHASILYIIMSTTSEKGQNIDYLYVALIFLD